METIDLLDPTRHTLGAVAARLAGLVRTLPRTDIPIAGSEWTVREAVVHTVFMADLYSEIAAGTPGPIEGFSVETVARRNAERNADNPETDPGKLADQIERSAERFLAGTAGRSGAEQVHYVEFAPDRIGLATLAGILLGEFVVHGFDVAATAGVPWPISVDEAMLTLGGYAPVLGMVTNPATAPGHTGAYGVSLRGGPSFVVRFTDGVYALEPDGPVDCEISADPIAFLLVATGRLSPWHAIALGLLGAGGEHPERAMTFLTLFVFP